MVVVTLVHGEEEDQEEVLSWSPGTSDALLQQAARCLLSLPDDNTPLFVVDAHTPPSIACKRDALLLSGGLAHGSRVRVYTAAARAVLPNYRPGAAEAGAAEALSGLAGADAGKKAEGAAGGVARLPPLRNGAIDACEPSGASDALAPPSFLHTHQPVG